MIISAAGRTLFLHTYSGPAWDNLKSPRARIWIWRFFSIALPTLMSAVFYDFLKGLDMQVGTEEFDIEVDILVLNRCEDFVLKNEVLKGELLFCRDAELLFACRLFFLDAENV